MTSETKSDEELLRELATVDVAIWSELFGLRGETGEKLEWKNHLFLFDILNDFSPHQVIKKAAQIGFSTLAILKTLWAARHKGWDIIYTLPSQADVVDFVGGKVNRIISQNPVLRDFVKDRDTVEQKRVGDNVVYYRGTFTEKAALMVSSDLNVYDEEDRSKQDVIAQYASRLQASEYKGEWHFSNPSTLGNGVSRYWGLSDQKEWFIICSTCKKEQYLRWPENVDMERQMFVCSACHGELMNRAKGEWKPTAKGSWSGYHISLLMAPWVSAKEIINLYQTKSREYFANFVLGEPFIGEGNTVYKDLFLRNLTHEINSQENVIIGTDSGIEKHFVLGNQEGLFYYGKTEKWDDIHGFLKKYPRSIAVIDAMPDITGPRKLREAFPGRVFLNFYARDRKTLQLIRWGEKDEYGNVLSDRNRMIQFLIDEFADKRVPLQGTEGDWKEYMDHWFSLYRLEDHDLTGNPLIKWESSNGIDHFVHATVYWRIGMERFGRGKGEILGEKPAMFPVNAPSISFGERQSIPQFIYPEQEEDV